MTSTETPRVYMNPSTLRTIRECRGYTPTELGRKAGVSAGHIRNLELGTRRPGAPMVAKLATALGVRFDALVVNLDELAQLTVAELDPDDDAG